MDALLFVLIFIMIVGAFYFLGRMLSRVLHGDGLGSYSKRYDEAIHREPKDILPDSDLSDSERSQAMQSYRVSSERNRDP